MALARVKSGLPLANLFAFLRMAALPSGRDANHPDVSRFETAFAARYGSEYQGVAFCKARMALYHLLRAMDLKPGGEVVMTAIHVADFVNIIRLAGFQPIIADIGPGGFQVNMDDLRAKLTDRTAAILVTHLSGYASNMHEIMELAADRGISVIEDCSQAMDVRLSGQRLGTFGDAAIFSLSLFKSVCTLNGGIAICRDAAVVERLRQQTATLAPARMGALCLEAARNIAFHILLSRPVFSLFVFPMLRLFGQRKDHLANYQKTNKTTIRRTEIPSSFLTQYCRAQAQLGLAQLSTLDDREKRRRELAGILRNEIETFAPDILPAMQPDSENGYWLFPVLIDNPGRVKAGLASFSVDSSQMLLSAISREPAFAEDGFLAPHAEQIRETVLFLPMYPALTDQDVRYTARALEYVLRDG